MRCSSGNYSKTARCAKAAGLFAWLRGYLVFLESTQLGQDGDGDHTERRDILGRNPKEMPPLQQRAVKKPDRDGANDLPGARGRCLGGRVGR